MNVIIHPDDKISISDIATILGATEFSLSEVAKEKITNCRNYLDHKLEQNDIPIYGINTGFGALYDKKIIAEDLEKLQENLVISHACGMGEEVPKEIVKLMLYLKARGLSYGLSGVQEITVQRLVDYLNQEIYPVIFQQGSLGASGDLAPLAHLVLPMLNRGEVYIKGQRKNAADIEKFISNPFVKLKAKEGLALLNGTQFMSSYASYLCYQFDYLLTASLHTAAISIDAYNGRINPFDEKIQLARPYEGQITIAKRMRELLSDSEIIHQEGKHVQDPYSFRCIPQVYGASYDALQHVKRIVEIEINSVTDNPTIFAEHDEIISGGNFHGQPLAINLDYLAIAAAEIGSIVERRIYQLINGNRNLPGFLATDAGLNSGFMILQYAAASIVSQNKQLCTPASIDTIDSSRGQEDHVSMGANAATKCYKIIQNLEQLIGLEMMTASQALEFRRPLKTSSILEELIADFRKEVPFLKSDEYMHPYMKASGKFIKTKFS